MESAKPQKEHLWLQKLAGNWTYEAEASMGPDQPPMRNSGKETARILGGLWMVAEGDGVTPEGEPATMIMTLGFNPETKRYVGTWIGSMMTHLWVYDGSLEGNTLNLDADGPSMAGDGKMSKYRDSIEFVNDNHRILRSQVQGDDGKWTLFMTSHYKRVS